MDPKKVAMVIGVAILLPLFLGLFVDAVYQEPKYEKFCGNDLNYATVPKTVPPNVVCTEPYDTEESRNCSNAQGIPRYTYDANGCSHFESCDYCSKDFNNAQQQYNRNIFFILAPIGLIIVIIGIYLAVDYLGVGLMFAGLITMFYATMRTFSELSKLVRALVILAELLIIIWIGYRKIGNSGKTESKKKR
jgi:hypothetical protein